MVIFDGSNGNVMRNVVLVDPNKFMDVFNVEANLTGYEQYRVAQTYQNDSGKTKTFDIIMDVTPFNGVLAIFGAMATGNGEKKYGKTWAKQVCEVFANILAPRGARVIQEGDTLKILTGLERHTMEPKFRYIHSVHEQDLELWLGMKQHLSDDESTQYYRLDGIIYSNEAFTLRSGNDYVQPKSVIELQDITLSHPVYYTEKQGEDHYVEVMELSHLEWKTGAIYSQFSTQVEFRFAHSTTDFGAYAHVQIQKAYHPEMLDINKGWEQVRTHAEWKVLIQGKKNRDTIQQSFYFVHPEIMGAAVVQYPIGTSVMIIDVPENDPRHNLNGKSGIVIEDDKLWVRVKFLDYFELEFDKRNVVAFQERFQAKYDQYAERDGQRFTVMRKLTDEERDLGEVGRMWKIRFENDGIEVDAWPEEVEVGR